MATRLSCPGHSRTGPGAAAPHGAGPLFRPCATHPQNRIASYDFPPGRESLRVQIARRMADAGCHISPDDVVITGGCQESLSLSLRAVASPGDVIAIESPTFYGILQAIESQGMRALELPTEPGGGIHPDTLETAISRWPIQACVAMPNYGNPLGHLASNERKEATVKLLADKNIPLIEDDVYGELGFSGERPLGGQGLGY